MLNDEEFKGEPPEHMRANEYDSTCFKQCGWCRYASGSHRFNYCIEGRCGLLRNYGDESEVKWDTPCKLKGCSKDELEALQRYHDYKIDSAKTTIVRHKEYKDALKILGKSAPTRPALPDDRKSDHFNLEDKVRVFYEGTWKTGTVKYGYRHHDGCVSYRLDNVGPQETGFWGSGLAIPHILLEKEYQFFKENPEEYDVWCKKAYDKTFNGKTLIKPEIL